MGGKHSPVVRVDVLLYFNAELGLWLLPNARENVCSFVWKLPTHQVHDMQAFFSFNDVASLVVVVCMCRMSRFMSFWV